ncbi:hypothetical protein B0H13DRAFT_1851540 [Mycena leptocephala]|nr:hypothetical protein B0H13DRAFT_1851540 [Mycena leptocephala]
MTIYAPGISGLRDGGKYQLGHDKFSRRTRKRSARIPVVARDEGRRHGRTNGGIHTGAVSRVQEETHSCVFRIPGRRRGKLGLDVAGCVTHAAHSRRRRCAECGSDGRGGYAKMRASRRRGRRRTGQAGGSRAGLGLRPGTLIVHRGWYFAEDDEGVRKRMTAAGAGHAGGGVRHAGDGSGCTRQVVRAGPRGIWLPGVGRRQRGRARWKTAAAAVAQFTGGARHFGGGWQAEASSGGGIVRNLLVASVGRGYGSGLKSGNPDPYPGNPYPMRLEKQAKTATNLVRVGTGLKFFQPVTRTRPTQPGNPRVLPEPVPHPTRGRGEGEDWVVQDGEQARRVLCMREVMHTVAVSGGWIGIKERRSRCERRRRGRRGRRGTPTSTLRMGSTVRVVSEILKLRSTNLPRPVDVKRKNTAAARGIEIVMRKASNCKKVNRSLTIWRRHAQKSIATTSLSPRAKKSQKRYGFEDQWSIRSPVQSQYHNYGHQRMAGSPVCGHQYNVCRGTVPNHLLASKVPGKSSVADNAISTQSSIPEKITLKDHEEGDASGVLKGLESNTEKPDS